MSFEKLLIFWSMVFVIAKFPEHKHFIFDLLTDEYEIFVTDIQWVAPRPTTFRIVLGNGEPFLLTYTPRSWIAQVEGKKYYLLNLDEEEYAAQAISRILQYGPKSGADAAATEDAGAGAEDTGAEEEVDVNVDTEA
jgi:hypothetical protein